MFLTGNAMSSPMAVIPQAYRAPIDPGAVKQSFGIHPYAPLIMYIGRLAYQKGPDLLVDAIAAVQRHRWDAQVLIAGDGGMRNHLESKARDLPVKFLGYIPDSAYLRLLNAADIVTIPSRNEPFGLVLLEAWSAGKCVVATNVGGLSENIEHSVNGIKVDVTPDSLAWGIINIIDNPVRVRSLGEKGRRKVERYFQWVPIVNTLMESYKKVKT
jgi:glycosyltransferase involved in cell wall biosynthesis